MLLDMVLALVTLGPTKLGCHTISFLHLNTLGLSLPIYVKKFSWVGLRVHSFFYHFQIFNVTLWAWFLKNTPLSGEPFITSPTRKGTA